MLANLIKVGLLLVGMLGAGESVKLIQLDVFRPHIGDHFPVGGGGLELGALSPTLDGGRMNAFDAGNRLRAQSFEALLNGALNLLFRRFKVVEGRSKAHAECLPPLPAANAKAHMTAPNSLP